MNPQDLISALRGPQNPLFGVPPQHLQQMAGNVVYPPAGRFLPIDPGDPYSLSDAAQRYENTMKLGGTQALQLLGGQRPANVLTLSPRAIDRYLR